MDNLYKRWFMENLCRVIKNYGISTEEMCNAISRLPKIPFSEMDIALIKGNPSLSLFQKWKLIKEVKKNMAID